MIKATHNQMDLSIECAISRQCKTWLLQQIIDAWTFSDFENILITMEEMGYMSYHDSVEWLAKYDKPHHLQFALAQAIDDAKDE